MVLSPPSTFPKGLRNAAFIQHLRFIAPIIVSIKCLAIRVTNISPNYWSLNLDGIGNMTLSPEGEAKEADGEGDTLL